MDVAVSGSGPSFHPTSVDVPPAMAPLFGQAEAVVSEYFRRFNRAPEQGTLEVWDERYILVRGASLSVEFFNLARDLFGEGREWEAHEFSRNILYDLAHAIGKSDARNFHRKMGLTDPVARLSAGPVHFAHSGWAYVKVLPESCPVPSDDYYLIYDHPTAFEADGWIEQGQHSDFPVCVMNSGYSAGWCEESFGISLLATEVQCRAKGDSQCRFIMAPPHRLEEHVASYATKRPGVQDNFSLKTATDLFSRKRLELDLSRSESLYRGICDSMFDGIVILSTDGEIVECNPSAEEILGKSSEVLRGQNLSGFLELAKVIPLAAGDELVDNDLKIRTCETQLTRADGMRLNVEVRTTRLDYKGSAHILTVIRDISNRKRAEADLAEANAKLVASSRDAGKAEIATGVLHNVGNVMNSVNVSTCLMSDTIQERVLSQLDRTVGLLVEHEEKLGEFLSQADRGKHLIQILGKVASETKEVASELKNLRENVDHVKGVIAAQQSFATLGAVDMRVDLGEAIADAMKICQESYRQAQIKLIAQADESLTVVLDKQKLIQILVNLLNNAREAVSQHNGERREVMIRGQQRGPSFEISVQDTGIGISEENLVKIFSHGFTTRKGTGGHGFGLHHSANAAVEMGGRLRVSSDGVGHGATFSLTIPMEGNRDAAHSLD